MDVREAQTRWLAARLYVSLAGQSFETALKSIHLGAYTAPFGTGRVRVWNVAADIVDHIADLPFGPRAAGPAAVSPDFLALCRLLAPVLAGAAGDGISAMECAALAEQVLKDLRGGALAGAALVAHADGGGQ